MKQEFRNEHRYHETEAGLGDVFKTDFREAFQKVLESPKSFSFVQGDVRRIRLGVFKKLMIVYRYYPVFDYVFFIALAHQSRKPFYWKDRRGGA